MTAAELRDLCLSFRRRGDVEDSYDLVVSALPKRVRAELGWSPDA